MIFVIAQILGVNEDPSPAVLELEFADAFGCKHAFSEKEPILFERPPSSAEPYPALASIACTVAERWRDENGRELCRIDTELPWHIASSEAKTEFVVLASQLVHSSTVPPVGLAGSRKG